MDLEELARDIGLHNDEVKKRFDEQKTAFDAMGPKLDSTAAIVTELEQTVASIRRGGGGGGAPSERKSWGQQVVEAKEYQDFMAAGGKGRLRLELKTVTGLTSATSGEGGVGGLVAPDRQVPVAMPMRRFTVRDLLAPGKTTSNLIQVPVQTSRNLNAGVVAEGATKPQSDITYELQDFPVATIAHWINASKQILADAPVLQATLDTEMRYGVQYAEDQQLLFGTGTNGNLTGLCLQASPLAAAPFEITGETDVDALRVAMLQVRLALYPATGFVLNPTDWAKLQLLKDGMGRYLFGDPQETGTPQMWGLPVAEADAMPPGNFLCGALGLAAQIFDREEAEVLISTENQDNFIRNLVTILGEERLALVVRRPAALVYGTFPGGTASTTAV